MRYLMTSDQEDMVCISFAVNVGQFLHTWHTMYCATGSFNECIYTSARARGVVVIVARIEPNRNLRGGCLFFHFTLKSSEKALIHLFTLS